MSPFIETMKLQDGELKNLPYHQARFNRTRRDHFGLVDHPMLIGQIPVPDGLETGLYKCRVLYGEEIERIEYEPHVQRKANSLKLVTSDTIDYGYKYSDRSSLEALFKQRGDCDDILIVKNGHITDSYYANLVLNDGTGWYTPDTPLLPGTMRAYLIEKGIVREAIIGIRDLADFQKIRLINALHNLEEAPEISTQNIR